MVPGATGSSLCYDFVKEEEIDRQKAGGRGKLKQDNDKSLSP